MGAMMIVASSRDQMGKFRARGALRAIGWAATIVMAGASVAMIASFAIG